MDCGLIWRRKTRSWLLDIRYEKADLPQISHCGSSESGVQCRHHSVGPEAHVVIRALRCISLLAAFTFSLSAFGFANFTQPTPEELKMTADPGAPGAPAEYLYLETWSGRGPFTIYARIKIFTEKGKEEYSDIHMDYIKGADSFNSVEARTIHPDGTVIPFTGEPYNKEIVSFRGYTRMQKVFSMPDVQVGSILEFRCRINSPYSGGWYIQQPLFVRKAAFHFFGRSDLPVHRTEILPPGVRVTGTPMGGYDLVMENIPPLPDEEYSPPIHALGYRVQFLYTTYTSAAEFWKSEGKAWSGDVNDVTYPSGKLKEAVDGLIAPGDTDTQKLAKIYAAVMKLENTSFSRTRTREEDKAQKVKIRTANDIWTAQRGDRDDLTLLFVTMAKAARMKAYVMYVTDRSSDIFLKDVPNWSQLDDLIAIVNVDGREMFFDPGERYCEFGKLKWTHTWTGGIRQTDFSGAEVANTPPPTYADTEIERRAELQIDPDSGIHGTIRVSMTGDEALRWRQEALLKDEEETKKNFRDELQQTMPAGVQLTITELEGLTDSTQPLAAVLTVSGSMGTKTGHRLFVPGTFLEAGTKPVFTSAKRENPVYLNFPYTEQDQVKVKLPANATVEAVPSDGQVAFAPNADFVSKYRSAGGTYQYARRVRVANILYQTQEYPQLRDFFQKISAQDQQPVVLEQGPTVAGKGN
jgi:hypothetical protein